MSRQKSRMIYQIEANWEWSLNNYGTFRVKSKLAMLKKASKLPKEAYPLTIFKGTFNIRRYLKNNRNGVRWAKYTYTLQKRYDDVSLLMAPPYRK